MSPLSLVLISSTAYSMCVPPTPIFCNCAFPKFEDGKLTCGPIYCPRGTSCVSDGSCCTNPDAEGIFCCDKTGKNKETGSCCKNLTTANCPTGIIDNQTTGCKECICPANAPVYSTFTYQRWKCNNRVCDQECNYITSEKEATITETKCCQLGTVPTLLESTVYAAVCPEESNTSTKIACCKEGVGTIKYAEDRGEEEPRTISIQQVCREDCNGRCAS